VVQKRRKSTHFWHILRLQEEKKKKSGEKKKDRVSIRRTFRSAELTGRRPMKKKGGETTKPSTIPRCIVKKAGGKKKEGKKEGKKT